MHYITGGILDRKSRILSILVVSRREELSLRGGFQHHNRQSLKGTTLNSMARLPDLDKGHLLHSFHPLQNGMRQSCLVPLNVFIALCVYPHCKVSIGQYTKMCTSPLIFFSSIISDDKYLRKIFDHFHFHCIFDHLSHEQSQP